jgi:hypothetical protein
MPHKAAGPESGVVIPTTTSVSVTPRTSAALPLAGMIKMRAIRIPIKNDVFRIMTSYKLKGLLAVNPFNRYYRMDNWCCLIYPYYICDVSKRLCRPLNLALIPDAN